MTIAGGSIPRDIAADAWCCDIVVVVAQEK
jgi:hypothetical protein